MEVIHRGYRYSLEVQYDDGTSAAGMKMRLFNRATHYVYSQSSTSKDEHTAVFDLSASKTLSIPVGRYDLELYGDGGALIMVCHNYVDVIESGAEITVTE